MASEKGWSEGAGAGDQKLEKTLQGGLRFGDLRQASCGILEMAQEFLVEVEGIGFLSFLLKDFGKIELSKRAGEGIVAGNNEGI